MLPPGVRFGRERVTVKVQQVVRLRSPTLSSSRATAQRRIVQILQEADGTMPAADLVNALQQATKYYRPSPQRV